jgi:hypothetical protein
MPLFWDKFSLPPQQADQTDTDTHADVCSRISDNLLHVWLYRNNVAKIPSEYLSGTE